MHHSYLERMGENELTKRIFKSGVNVVGVRGQAHMTWEDGMLE